MCEKIPVPAIIACVVIIFATAQILNMPNISVYRFGIYGAGFFLGYFIFSHDVVMERIEKWCYILSSIAIISGIAFVILYWGKPYAQHEVLDTFMCNLFAWMATLGILSFMKKWGNFENSFTRFMNKKSWGLYIFHYLPLTACAWYLSLYAKNMPVLLHYIVVGISSFVGAFILYELISRIPMNLGFPPKGKHVFGIVKVGDKGQIVIPAKARKIFNITAGDNLIVLGDEEQGIALIKEDGFLKLLQEARDKS